METKNTIRYSDAKLAIFKAHIQAKLLENQNYCDELEVEIKEAIENGEGDLSSNFMESSSIHNHIQMMHDMLGRRRKLIHDLEKALVRIEQKNYGICVVTGERIDEKRLMAAPITTKSLAAKLNKGDKKILRIQRDDEKAPVKKIITKINRKRNSPLLTNKSDYLSDDEMDYDDNGYEEGLNERISYNFDELSDGSSLGDI